MAEPKEKSCFWCNSKKHYGINCKKRPKDLVEAYMKGKEDEYNRFLHEYAYITKDREMLKKYNRIKELKDTIAELEGNNVALRGMIRQLKEAKKHGDK